MLGSIHRYFWSFYLYARNSSRHLGYSPEQTKPQKVGSPSESILELGVGQQQISRVYNVEGGDKS